MHPELHPRPFTESGWLFEHELDGFRTLARVSGGRVEILSRTGRSLAAAFPEVVRSIERIASDVVLDGELVVPDARGHPSFEAVRRRALMRRRIAIAEAARDTPAAFYAFDLIAVDGADLRPLPLVARKDRLFALLGGCANVHALAHIEAHGIALFEQAVKLDLEGNVAKRADSPYQPGRRSRRLKIKNRRTRGERRSSDSANSSASSVWTLQHALPAVTRRRYYAATRGRQRISATAGVL